MMTAGVLPNMVMVFGQMNEPPGSRFWVGHVALTMAEYFGDDEHQDVLLYTDAPLKDEDRTSIIELARKALERFLPKPEAKAEPAAEPGTKSASAPSAKPESKPKAASKDKA